MREDVPFTLQFYEGFTLVQGSEISTTTGVEVSLEISAEYGPVSGTLSTTVSHEISSTRNVEMTSESSATQEVSYVFPAHQDCTLFQRKMFFRSALATDSLQITPRDFKLVCTPSPWSSAPAAVEEEEDAGDAGGTEATAAATRPCPMSATLNLDVPVNFADEQGTEGGEGEEGTA